jgi:hypothetical protein
MAKFYFMDQEFSGAHFNKIGSAAIWENNEVELDYSWEWFYDFFFITEPGGWGSDESSSLRSHLLNMAATFYKYHDVILKKAALEETDIQEAIDELLEMVEASKGHLVSFWTYGDESNKKDLDEERAALPSEEQMAKVLTLPHVEYRMRRVMPEYLVMDEKMALKRYRNELADMNRRKKLAQKNQQRESAAGMPS